MSAQTNAALRYWDRVLIGVYDRRTELLGRRLSKLESAGFTRSEQVLMLTRNWRGQLADRGLSEERAAEMAQLLVSDLPEFISYQAQMGSDS